MNEALWILVRLLSNLLGLPETVPIFETTVSSLRGIQIVGQEAEEFGALDALITVYLKDGLPAVSTRLTNSGDATVWWSENGGRYRSGGWSILPKGSGGMSWTNLGCSPGTHDRRPTNRELEEWAIAPGECFWDIDICNEARFKTAMKGAETTNLGRWSRHGDFTFPLEEEPHLFHGLWLRGKIRVEVSESGEATTIELKSPYELVGPRGPMGGRLERSRRAAQD